MVRKTAVSLWTALFYLAMIESTTTAFCKKTLPVKVRRTNSRSMNPGRMPLLYSSDDNDGSTTSSSSSQQLRWWSTLPSSNACAGAAAISKELSFSSNGEATQQESVDAYLEFLDRRYKRIHSTEIGNKQQPPQTNHSQPKSFSAMEWLMKGRSTTNDSIEDVRRQQEDALYVLGVAGLASQKLLQKHHLHTKSTSTQEEDDTIEVHAMADEEDEKMLIQAPFPASHIIIKRVLVPMIRAFYILQRCRDLAVQRIQRAFRVVAFKAVHKIVAPFSATIRKGPKVLLETMLEVGGGKRNIAFTLAFAYATMILLRPVLQSAVTEQSVIP